MKLALTLTVVYAIVLTQCAKGFSGNDFIWADLSEKSGTFDTAHRNTPWLDGIRSAKRGECILWIVSKYCGADVINEARVYLDDIR